MKQKSAKIAFLAVAALLIGGCQAMNLDHEEQSIKESEKYTRDEVKEKVIKAVEDKYGEEFDLQSIESSSWYTGYIDYLFLYPKGGNPKDHFQVSHNHGEIHDDYVEYVMGKRYQKRAKEIVQKYFPKSVVDSGMLLHGITPDEFRPSMAFSEFQKYANKNGEIGVRVFLPIPDKKELKMETVEQIKNELSKLIVNGRVRFTGYTPEGFEEHVVNDPYDSIKNKSAFPDVGQKYVVEFGWGKLKDQNQEDTK